MSKYIDLHTHTIASDGSMTPSQLVQYAAQKHLAAIAITDHDTVKGVEEAVVQGKQSNIEVIPGVEISVDFEGEMHILGYFIDVESPILNNTLERLKTFRKQRNPQIIQKLNELGIEITMAEVQRKANSEIIGRPHIADVMIQKGYISSIDEAFDKYLDKGKPAYVKKQKLLPKEGIELIKQAGGFAVLAHPIYLEEEGVELEILLKQLIQYGLDGIEAYYSEYTKGTQNKYLAIANKYNLIVTGGSDFHGKTKPKLDLGTGYGALRIPYHLLERMKRARGIL
ncbi:MAG: 3,5-nucleoside bisphosphate phosphatase [Clostridiales bacterium]|nr:3,5-nucleoside bisphosphate phosphatase [Clostridiales bacterium]